MKNTITVTTLPNKQVKTDIVTCDGVSRMEMHKPGLSDSKVLKRLHALKHYQHFKGEWVIVFPKEDHAITKPDFNKLMSAADMYIFNRDNSVGYDGTF